MKPIDADEIPWITDSTPYAHIEGFQTVTKMAIDNMPTIDAEPIRHGRWIFGNTLGHSWMKCSECCVSQNGQTACFSYCPNCGAKMDGEKKEE